MLKAILRGKSRFASLAASETERSEYRDYEDPLTSFVFGNLLYLPADLMWRIVRRAAGQINAVVAGDCGLPATPGEMQSVEFWPSWWLTQARESRQRVEPDVFLAYRDLDIIIEAKRHDDLDVQDPAQLARELAAYIQTKTIGKPVYLMAVGGTHRADWETADRLQNTVVEQTSVLIGGTFVANPHIRICVVPWLRVLRTIREVIDAEVHPRHHRAVLEDILAVFELHGVIDWQPTWLSDLSECIGKFHLVVSTYTKIEWKTASALSPKDDEESTADWWRISRVYGPISEGSQKVLKRFMSGDSQ